MFQHQQAQQQHLVLTISDRGDARFFPAVILYHWEEAVEWVAVLVWRSVVTSTDTRRMGMLPTLLWTLS